MGAWNRIDRGQEKGKGMGEEMTISFIAGAFTGAFFGITIMCIVSINRYNDYKETDPNWALYIEDKKNRGE